MFGRVLTSNLGRVLGTLLIIGVAGSTVSYGTFATFTAQTTNAGNTFSTGTLALTNIKSGGTTCLSTGIGGVDSNVNNSTTNAARCDTLFTAGTGAGLAPGGDLVTSTVGIHNSGTLSASTLKLWSETCGNSANSAVPAAQQGTGDPCPLVAVSIYNTTTSTCVLGTGATCDPAIANPNGNLASFYTSGSPLTAASNLAAGTGMTFTFEIQLSSTAGNSMQGRVASTTFHWQATQ